MNMSIEYRVAEYIITLLRFFCVCLCVLEYYGVVTIPPSARSIRVVESNSSRTFLALRNTHRKYYLNGHWKVDWPGQYTIAGSVFDYKRPYNGLESLTSTGPTSETLVVEVGSLFCPLPAIKPRSMSLIFFYILFSDPAARFEPRRAVGIHTNQSQDGEGNQAQTQIHMGCDSLRVLCYMCRRYTHTNTWQCSLW